VSDGVDKHTLGMDRITTLMPPWAGFWKWSNNMSDVRCFWRKRYTGYTSGYFTHLGRDDGYPEPRVIEYNDDEEGLADLCCDYGSCKDEHYEYVREIVTTHDSEAMDSFVHHHDMEQEKKQKEAAEEQERVNDERLLAKLAKKLGKTVT
jgi:hypothetical protein